MTLNVLGSLGHSLIELSRDVRGQREDQRKDMIFMSSLQLVLTSH